MRFFEKKLPALFRRFFPSEEGASSVEYGILAACIAAVVVLTIAALGQRLEAMYDRAVAIVSAFLQ